MYETWINSDQKILVTSYKIWVSKFVELNAKYLCKDEKLLHEVLKARWLSSKANATAVSVLEQTIEELTETGYRFSYLDNAIF